MIFPNYIVIDAARVGNSIKDVLLLAGKSDSLYTGSSKHDMEFVAPYLCKFEREGELFKWLEQDLKNCENVLFIYTAVPFEVLLAHLQKFIFVSSEKEEFYFRFYDPRVLPIFLPTCSQEQIGVFFGPIQYFYCSDSNIVRGFQHRNYILRTEQYALTDFLAGIYTNSIDNSPGKESQTAEISPEVNKRQAIESGHLNENESKKKGKWKDFFFD